MEKKEIIAKALRYGLEITDDIRFNEMGLDFRVGFVTDVKGDKWVLRIPRRPDLGNAIDRERAILDLVKAYLSVEVPDWKIVSGELIAYPLLEDPPVLEFDAKSYEVTWHIDPKDSKYTSSLAKILVEIHQIPTAEAISNGLKSVRIEEARQEVLDHIELVKRELGIGADLESRWRRWVDNNALWPDFTTFVHGDLYAGHVLSTNDGTVTGIIDWSEGQVNDPSIDLSGQIATFGEEGLKELIAEYEQLGGKVWDTIFEQTVERHAAAALKYGVFAINAQSDVHIEAAKAQLS